MTHSIQNQSITITVDEQGAELKSLRRLNDNVEILWQADPTYWNGQSPVLFPSVGSCRNATAWFDGKPYPMPKHGLVHDMPFRLTEKTADTIALTVCDTEETRKHFPFPFHFTVRFHIEGYRLEVVFDVKNDGDKAMPFHLGAHPAFALPGFHESDEVHGYLSFGGQRQLISDGLQPGGLLWPEGSFTVALDEQGMLPLMNHTFDCDTLLDSRGELSVCTLSDMERQPVVTVRFNSPILALWAPCGGRAPFVCIEPWWGCCDLYNYEGEFSQRRFTNLLSAHTGETLSYSIEIHETATAKT